MRAANHKLTSYIMNGVVAIVIGFCPSAGASAWEARPTDSDALIRGAKAFSEDLAAGRYDEAHKRFDKTMTEAMPPESLRGMWANIQRQAGAFEKFGEAIYKQESGYHMVYVESKFALITLRLKVVFDQERKIAGFWVQPGPQPSTQPDSASPPARLPGAYSPPKYDKADAYDMEYVTYGIPDWKINGVMTIPKGDGPFPAVVLVHGSGPHDEDETIGPNKPFKDLAGGLSSRGIAVLRYQKRTHAHRTRMAGVSRISVREEVIDDTLEGLKLLRTREKIDANRLFIVGHSLGATLAPQIAQEDGKAAGIVLLAGTARDLTDVLIDQLDYIAALPLPNQSDNQKFYDEALTTIAKVRNGELGDDATVLNVPMSYWKELSEAAELSLGYARLLKCRILIAAGGRDYQVTRKDFDIYRRALEGRPNVTLKWFKDSNHLFFRGKGMSTPQEYGRSGHVDRNVIEFLARWIKSEKGQ